MIRPCFLVIDREQPGGISTRKLVIETAKLNVITVYSGSEALETLKKFPRVDGAVIDSNADSDVPCAELVQQLKAIQSGLRVVSIGRYDCDGADYQLDSFDPLRLLAVLQRLEPEKTEQILKRDEELQANSDCSPEPVSLNPSDVGRD